MGQLRTASPTRSSTLRAQYDSANAQLAQIQRQLRENRHELRVAKSNLHESQRTIAKRLVTLYTTDQASTLEVILGAKNLDDMINRMDSAKSVTALDTRILSQVKTFRTSVKRHGTALANARASQARVVAERAAAKQSIESKITEQNNLLSSLKGQIAQARRGRRRETAADGALKRRRDLQLSSAPPGAAVDHGGRRLRDARCSGRRSSRRPDPQQRREHRASQLGTPYVWAGSAPGGFDCSGLVMWAYAQVGVSLPHSSYGQYGYGVPVSRDQLQAGDLVFFDGLGHVGIYIGGGQFVHAPHTGDVVKISSLDESW